MTYTGLYLLNLLYFRMALRSSVKEVIRRNSSLSLLLICFLIQVANLRGFEYLEKQEKGFILSLHLDLSQHDILPNSLSKLVFNEFDIEELKVFMGYTTPHGDKVTQGIEVYVKNRTSLLNQQIQQIGAIFSTSRDPTFSVFLPLVNLTLISNPNDKFCAQHLTNLFKMFLPCRRNAGLFSLLDFSQILKGDFFQTRLQWRRQQLVMEFYFPLQNQQLWHQLVNYKKKHVQCAYVKILNSEQVVFNSSVSEEKKSQIGFSDHLSVLSFTRGIWYDIDKKLITIIALKNSSYIEKVALKYLIPEGFRVDQIIVASGENFIYHYNIVHQFRGVEGNTYVQVNICPINATQRNKEEKIRIEIGIAAGMKAFEKYENIAGGGEELMSIPTQVIYRNGTVVLVRNDNQPLFSRLLEPDFSLPFHILTFVLVCVGYLLSAIWRAFFQVLQEGLPFFVTGSRGEKHLSNCEKNLDKVLGGPQNKQTTLNQNRLKASKMAKNERKEKGKLQTEQIKKWFEEKQKIDSS